MDKPRKSQSRKVRSHVRFLSHRVDQSPGSGHPERKSIPARRGPRAGHVTTSHKSNKKTMGTPSWRVRSRCASSNLSSASHWTLKRMWSARTEESTRTEPGALMPRIGRSCPLTRSISNSKAPIAWSHWHSGGCFSQQPMSHNKYKTTVGCSKELRPSKPRPVPGKMYKALKHFCFFETFPRQCVLFLYKAASHAGIFFFYQQPKIYMFLMFNHNYYL
uniref:Uncharacterized protein n=1 Tax=Pipistrellus kuhlii TaxID=59472 RepID=A0A7J7XAX1_PIPKU|nr:hypothetical protein mPipKuh1_010617 [Pipistrellus kuhlii]